MNPINQARGTVVIGGTESDAHVVSIYLLSLILESNGFQVENMRCFNTASDFVERAMQTNAQTIVISNQNGQAYDDLIELPDAMKKGCDATVILGGHYYVGVGEKEQHEARLRNVGVNRFAYTMDELLGQLKDLEP